MHQVRSKSSIIFTATGILTLIILSFTGCLLEIDSISHDALLSDIELSAGELSPEFTPSGTSYRVSVPREVDSIEINATLHDKDARLSENVGVPQPLDVGENEIIITVTAQDKSTKEYVLKVTREAGVDSYAITYNLDGGTNNVSNPANYTIEDSEITLLDPTKTGYTFDGWYRDSEFTVSSSTIAAGSTESKTFYAKWTANTYTITFNKTDGNSVTDTTKDVTYDNTYGTLPTATRTGYTFDGWFTASTGGTKITSDSKVTITADTTLFAQWTANTYTITFSKNGGDSVTSSSKDVTYDNTYGTLPTATRTGYTFDGWFTASTGGTEITADSTVAITADTTLYAQWDAGAFTVSFDKNNDDATGNMSSVAMDNGESAPLVKNTFVLEGYTFEGWSLTSDGSVDYTDEADFTMGAENVTLFAQWTANTYTITFSKNGGDSVTEATQEVTYDSTYGTLPTALRTGYTFDGWFTASTGGTEITSDSTVTITADTTLYAQWTIDTYAITYDANSGSGSISDGSKTYNVEYTLSDGTGFTKTGYTFSGWNTASDGSGTDYASGATYSLNSNLDLFAQWTIDTYTITYYANSGSGSISDGTKTYNVGFTLSDGTGLTKTGYTFSGWNTASDGSGTDYAAGATYSLNSDLDLFAQWTALTHTLSFNKNADDAVGILDDISLDTDELTTLPENTITRAGYNFTGWNTASNGSGSSYADQSSFAMGTDDVTLYAQWDAGEFTLSFDKNHVDATGSMLDISLNNGESTTLTSIGFSRNGYTFAGWSLTSDGSVDYADEASFTMSTSNVTLYALWTANSYTITFDKTDGDSVTTGTKEVTYDSTYGTLPTGTRTGYTFDGWFTASTGGTEITSDSTVAITADTTLYAQWTATSYVITYNLDGGMNNVSNPESYTIESSEITLLDPTKTGYAFGGWYSDSELTVSSSTIAAGSTGAKTFYAKWTATSYAITYNLDGGTNNVSNPASYTIESSEITLLDPTKTGYTFGGWYSDSELTVSSSTIAAGSTEAKTFYAKWTANTYTVTFDKTDGDSVTSATGDVTYDSTYGTLPTASRTGYTFDGWFTASTGGTEITSDSTVAITADTTLYAHWTIDTYAITYDANSGSGSISDGTKTYNVEYTLSDGTGFTKTGYTFSGWNTASDGSGTDYAAGATYSLNSDLDLFAQWTIDTYTITYDANSGSGSISDGTKTYNVRFTLSDGTGFTKTGYTFSGWNTASDGSGTDYAAGATYSLNSDLDLFAQWTATSYAITYNLDGGTNNVSNPASYTIESNEITLLDPTKTGYTFGGWYSDSGLTVSSSTIAAGSTGAKTFYAKWTADSYAITYNLDGGTNDVNNPASYTIEDSEITLLDPTKTGYTFGGWYSDSGLTVSSSTIAAGSTGPRTFYAKWTATSYAITYNLDGGTNNGSNPASYTIEDSLITLLDPTKTGYTFGGWYSDSGLTVSSSTIAAGSTGAKTFYAKWTVTTYTITYDTNGGSGSVSDGTKTYNAGYTLSDGTGISYTGYTFSGWNTASDGNGTDYAAGALYTANEDLDLFAQWTPISYSITYNLNGGINDAANPTSYTIESSTITIQNPSKTGNSFDGWYSDPELTISASSTITTGSTGDKIFYAKWIPATYTVSYVANGGSGSVSDDTKTYGEDLTLSDGTGLSYTGYTFTGWNTLSNGSGTAYSPSGTYSVNTDVTLYAQWTNLATYTVSYDANSADSGTAPASQVKIQDTAIILEGNTGSLSRVGYSFEGWNTSSDGTGTHYEVGATYSSNSDLSLDAEWTALPTYTVSYDANLADSGTVPADQSKIQGVDLTLATNTGTLIKVGYSFDGWNTAADGTGTDYSAGGTYTADTALTLYAKWVEPVSKSVSTTGITLTGSDKLGDSIAIAGNTAIVGVPYDDTNGTDAGGAYIYVYADGDWSISQTLIPADAAAGDNVGYSVSISDTYAFVGSPYDDNANGIDAGAVYVYKNNGGTWEYHDTLIADTLNGGSAYDYYGWSVSNSDAYAVVGAPNDEGNKEDAGSIYFYELSADTWGSELRQQVTASGKQDYFGTSVSLSGTTAVAGAPGNDDGGTGLGSAYVFDVTTGNNWTFSEQLYPTGMGNQADYGASVAISGDKMVIGAFGYQGLGDNSGAVFTYTYGTDWTSSETFYEAIDTKGGQFFGQSVAISGDYFVVGSPLHDDADGTIESGSAYVYHYDSSSTTWEVNKAMLASDGAIEDHFGNYVAISGDHILVGAPDHDTTVTDAGQIYAYEYDSASSAWLP